MTQIAALPRVPTLLGATPGVWVAWQGQFALIHPAQPTVLPYSLGDIVEYFELGEFIPAPDTVPEALGLTLDRREVTRLARLSSEARAEHPAPFIRLAEEICSLAAELDTPDLFLFEVTRDEP